MELANLALKREFYNKMLTFTLLTKQSFDEKFRRRTEMEGNAP